MCFLVVKNRSCAGVGGSGERGAEPADQADCCSFDAGTPLAAEVPDRALGGFRGAGHTVQGTDGRLRER